MRWVNKCIGILSWVLLVALSACSSDKLTDEKAIGLAKDRFVEEEVSKAKEWGAPLASRAAMNMLIKDAEVVSNDGETASVKLTIQLRPDFPTATKIIEVTKPE